MSLKPPVAMHVVIDGPNPLPTTGGGGGGGTVDQGAAGASAWPVSDASARTTLAAIQGLLAGTITTSDATAQGLLTTIEGLLAGTLTVVGAVAVSNFPATQPVSIASMPSTPVTNANLDVALSTRALEAGGNLAAARTDLDTIATRTPTLGQAAMAGSSPVVIAGDQTPISTTDAANGTPGATAPTKAEAAAGVDAAGLLRALRVDNAGMASVGTTSERQFLELDYFRQADELRMAMRTRGNERISMLSERGGGR